MITRLLTDRIDEWIERDVAKMAFISGLAPIGPFDTIQMVTERYGD